MTENILPLKRHCCPGTTLFAKTLALRLAASRGREGLSCQPSGCFKSSVEVGRTGEKLALNATMARNSMSRAIDLFWVRKEKQLAVLRRFLSSTVRLDEREARFFVSPGEKNGYSQQVIEA